jgi:hypothetical protein
MQLDKQDVLEAAGLGTMEDYQDWVSDAIRGTIHANKRHANGPKLWTHFYDRVRGDQYYYKTMEPGEDRSDELNQNTVVNITASHVDHYLALLTKTHYHAETEPEQPQWDRDAKIGGALVNQFWKSGSGDKVFERIVRDGLITGQGFAEVGWTLMLDQTRNPKKYGKIVTPDYIKVDAPYIRRIDPRNMLVDPEAPDNTLASARWAAEIFYMPAYDLFTNAKFDQKVIDDIRAGNYTIKEWNTSYWADDSESRRAKNLDPYNDRQVLSTRLECYNFWDTKMQRHMVYVKGVDQPIWVDDKLWPDWLHLPYVTWQFKPQNDDRFAQGIPLLLATTQAELNRNRAQMFEWRRRCANIQMFYDTTKIDKEFSEQELIDGRMAQLVGVEGDPNSVVASVKFADLSPTLFQIDQILQNDAIIADGLSGMEQGQPVESRVPATGVASQERFVNIRLKKALAAVDNLFVDIVTLWNSYMQDNLQKPMAVKIIGPAANDWMMEPGPDGAMVPVMATAQDIAGNYRIRISPSELPDLDPQSAATFAQNFQQSQLQMLPTTMQFQPAAAPDLLELNRWVLEKMNVKERNRIFPGIARVSPAVNMADQPEAGMAQGAMPPAPPPATSQGPVAPGSVSAGAMGGQSGGFQQ